MAKLILGPLLRYVDETQATVWVETDTPCMVEILERGEQTFCVEGHHYAIVALRDLKPGQTYEYEVALDGERAWPEADSPFPPSVIRPIDPDGTIKIVFGSCRVAVPHRPPYTLTKDQDDRGREIDALYALATRMRDNPPEHWPHLLLNIGDQVYADEDAPRTREFIRGRRDVRVPPHEEVLEFEEYTRLYWESWGDPTLRWLLSTVGSAMIFDDHDVHDDWNTSQAWLEEMRATPWWNERIESALMSYWIYQHLGNLSPRELDESELLERIKHTADGGPLLREFAAQADHSINGSRWSFSRTLGRTKILVFDSREGRVLEGTRKIVDDAEWRWVEQESTGDFDHLLLVDTLPGLLTPAEHYLEAWNEAVCAGAWGKAMQPLGERVRRALDLEHWAAFGNSFHKLVELVTQVATGERGRAPASVLLLGGDVHHAYLAEVGFPRSRGAKSAVYQAVCSPFRNALDSRERFVVRTGARKSVTWITRLLARAAGVRDPEIRWRLLQSPTFDNQFGTIELSGRHAVARIERTVPGDHERPGIETSLERRLA